MKPIKFVVTHEGEMEISVANRRLVTKFLKANHKRFWDMNDRMIDAWLDIAEDNFLRGAGRCLEIKSYESNDKQAHCLELYQAK